MDLLKEKYSNILTENKEGKPRIREFNDYFILRHQVRLIQIPRFLKHVYVGCVMLADLPKLKNLENCPECGILEIANCDNLQNLEGANCKDIELRGMIPDKPSLLKGLPEELNSITVYNEHFIIPSLITAIRSGIYKPKRIETIILKYTPFKDPVYIYGLKELKEKGILGDFGHLSSLKASGPFVPHK